MVALVAPLALGACGEEGSEATDDAPAAASPSASDSASVSASTSPSAVETGLTGDPLCDEVTPDELTAFGSGFGVQRATAGCEASDGSQTVTWELRPGALEPAAAGVPRGLAERADIGGTRGWEAREAGPDAGLGWVVVPHDGQTLVVSASVPMAESGDDTQALELARFVAVQIVS